MQSTSTTFRRPPGPADPVDLGIDRPTLDVLASLTNAHGPVVSIERSNGRLAYFVNDPDEVRRILVRRHPRYRKGPGFERVKMLLGNGLIVSDGDVWRRSRTMIQPAFKVQNVHRLMKVMVLCADERARHWSSVATAGGTINITEETNEFALALILRCIFGRDYETRRMRENNPFGFLSQDSARDLSVVMKVRELRELLLDIIADRQASSAEEQFDFLEMYLAATDKDGRKFTERELLDELMTLIVAGFETSANTLNWVWYLLAGEPAVEAAVIDEAARHMPDVDAVSADSAQAMVYTQQVLEETLRLYPPLARTRTVRSRTVRNRGEKEEGSALFSVFAWPAALPGRVFLFSRNEGSPGLAATAVSHGAPQPGSPGAGARDQPAFGKRYSSQGLRATGVV